MVLAQLTIAGALQGFDRRSIDRGKRDEKTRADGGQRVVGLGAAMKRRAGDPEAD